MEVAEEGQNQPRIPPKRMKLQELVGKGEEDRFSALPDCLLLEILSSLSSTKDAIRTAVGAMEVAEEGQNQPRIPPKRMKLQEIVGKEEEDRISALPDCLLIDILSRLHYTKGAIRTDTLSKRWNHLWTLLPDLSFLHNNKIPWSYFVSLVDKTLTQCRQLKLKKFRLHTVHYDSRSESQVNNWIRYAIRCNVEELDLMLYSLEFEDVHPLDQLFFTSSCFTNVILEGFIFNPVGAISWKNLRSLCISVEKLDEDLIENILSGSPLLETLVLNECSGYSRLNITSKSVKNLVFSGFNDPIDESDSNIIEINAPNILSLTIRDDLFLLKVVLVNVSSLVEAGLDYEKHGYYETTFEEAEEEMYKGFIQNLRHVKELKIGISCSEVLFRLEGKGFVFPSNMKVVRLNDYLEFVPL